MKKFIALASFVFAFFITSAQNGGGMTRLTPEERAEKQTLSMTEKLSLSEAQAEKVKAVMLKYALKMQAAREANTSDDREAIREQMKTLRDEQNAELKTLLTEEQWAEHEKMQQEREKRGFGPGRGRKEE